PAREARNAALHADHAVRAQPHLYRGIRAFAELGRPLLAAVLRHARLGNEAFLLAATAAGSWLHPWRDSRALYVHLDRALRRELDDALDRDADVPAVGPDPDAARAPGHPRTSWHQADADRFWCAAAVDGQRVPGRDAVPLPRDALDVDPLAV